jgi:hypothetical protein
LGWSLTNVEELAERKPDQRSDHDGRVHYGEEFITVAAHPF